MKRLGTALLLLAALAACAPAAVPTPEKVTVKETVIVQQTVPVTATPEPPRPKGTLTAAVTTDIIVGFPGESAADRSAAGESVRRAMILPSAAEIL